MPRAKTEFKHALPGIEIITHAVPQDNYKLFTRTFWRLSFVEYHKTLWRSVLLLFTPTTPFPVEDPPAVSAAAIKITESAD
jgi:hypothetical protein